MSNHVLTDEEFIRHPKSVTSLGLVGGISKFDKIMLVPILCNRKVQDGKPPDNGALLFVKCTTVLLGILIIPNQMILLHQEYHQGSF